MNYYKEIKELIINNEITKKAKDYSKNKSDLTTNYNVGKLLSEAGKKYGESIIIKYSEKLQNEVGKKYNARTLRRFRQYYIMFKDEKWSQVATILSWSHYTELLSMKDENKVLYYINQSILLNLSRNELREKIKNKEYERLDENTKLKLINKEETKVDDFIKNPIIIKNNSNYEVISEKVLQKLILEDIPSF